MSEQKTKYSTTNNPEGRPPIYGERMTNILVSLTREHIEKLEKAAARKCISRNHVIRDLIDSNLPD